MNPTNKRETIGLRSVALDKPKARDRQVRIPTIDLSGETERHVTIARGTDEVYQGHPTTLLMPDGKTMYCVWTLNHGGPCGPLKRSDDGGKTWSDPLAVPDNWRKVRNCPTLYRLVDSSGTARLFVFAGQGPDGTMHQSHSEDGGKSWTPMASNGLKCVMPFCTIVPIDGGKQLLAMSNIRRPNETEEQFSNVVSQSVSDDGGLTWSEWRIVLDIAGCKPCEPELVPSPDGKQLLCLIRENNREFNAWRMTSDDEGETWSEADPLPASLSGDRHMSAYALDGRLIICFRDTAARSPTRNHFVAWVGTYADIVNGGDGQYRVKLLHSYAGGDCGYPGLDVLPDGTLVATTYVKYEPGTRKHSVVSVRFTLDELDRKVRVGEFMSEETRAPGAPAIPNLAMSATASASSKFRVNGSEEAPGPLGEEVQLFVDDRRIASRSGVVRRVHACRKAPEPVLEPSMPWEGDDLDSRVYIYGSVLRDPETEQFRMWYNRGSYLLYATSDDGIHWTRPKLGLVDWMGNRDNNILPLSLHSPSIIRDEHETDPAKRYKALGYLGGGSGYGVAYSAEGLKWTLYPKNPVLPGGDTCTLSQDPRTHEYLAFHKLYRSHRDHQRRLVYLSRSKDMQDWTPQKLVMAPDKIDDAQTRVEGGLYSQFYNMSCFPYGGQFLGLVTHFRFTGEPQEKQGPDQSPADGPIDVQLVHSRDGRNWDRLEQRVPVIPNGPYDYDAGCILGVANSPVFVGDQMWLYYTAITTTHGGYMPKKRITIARAVWRRDGFVSLDADDEAGVVETVALQPVADQLFVNADASRGELRVEIREVTGRVVPGYEANACVPIKTDSVQCRVRWQAHDTLPTGKPIHFRFYPKHAKLFSYTVRAEGE